MIAPNRQDDSCAWLGRGLAEVIIPRMLDSLMPMTGYDLGRPARDVPPVQETTTGAIVMKTRTFTRRRHTRASAERARIELDLVLFCDVFFGVRASRIS